MSKVTYIDEVDIKNKTVLLRVDFNVSLGLNNTIADDVRIRQTIPTINYLLKNGDRIIIVSHLGRPKGVVDPKYSLSVVVKRLKEYFPKEDVVLCKTPDDVKKSKKKFMVLENIRFFPKEKNYSNLFAKELASMADVYINDAFGVSHRSDTSLVGTPKFLPSYGGLLLKKELEILSKATENPHRPFVTIIGGAKVSTKANVIQKLIEISDYILVGGGLANTFLCAQGVDIGGSFCEYEAVESARKILSLSKKNRAILEFPVDAIVADKNFRQMETVKIGEVPKGKSIFDIGPETQACFGNIIAQARTIIWNGPVGYFENPAFKNGTDFIYYSITENGRATKIVGGGDTLAAISRKEYLDKITHISTGGGAMLEYIEKGTLPAIEAIKK
ncbi:phosphoglycerate kinase [Candidatus Roizmanbacteria bacterium RIFCSPLOWO2_01_FULL_44_13]|uniref:Phosphoglycerate kinase n=1 Tax=Candidatus Roizmanbacteria bacterium RIFCSPLOWO2_01_FULL_44_13 TaxID=1802069 RepID=A0A1F7JB58_9BACT|nr:MAG: phosphoglycerate kinase [Candidatus Roizmanbacteria bacterium RIFCSPLOWO2_01_FULL_44_13]